MPPPGAPRFFVSPLLQPPLNKLFVPRPLPDILPPTDLHLDGYKGARVGPVAPYMARLDEADPVAFEPSLSAAERRLQRAQRAPAQWS